MKEFTLKKYSFGDFLGIVGDTGHPVLAEMRKRIDVDEDMPKLITAVGIKPGDIVIDVGGFIGDTAVPMLNAGAHVIVFEPFLDAFTALLYNTRNRGVQAHNTAVGNGEWVKFVYECPGPNYGMRRVKACDPADPEAFPTYRLESLMRPDDKWKVKLIKIDCEGFEIPTLRGAAESHPARQAVPLHRALRRRAHPGRVHPGGLGGRDQEPRVRHADVGRAPAVGLDVLAAMRGIFSKASIP